MASRSLKPRTGIGQYCAQPGRGTGIFVAARGNSKVYPPRPWKRLATRDSGAWRKSPEFRGASELRRLPQHPRRSQAGRKDAGGLAFRQLLPPLRSESFTTSRNYLPFAANVPTVITIHDLSVLLHPEWASRRPGCAKHVRKLERVSAAAAHIITDTEQVRREVIAELGVAAEKSRRSISGSALNSARFPRSN